MSTVGRNDPCSCGSGRKAKNCCQSSKGASGAASNAPMILLPAMEGLRAQEVHVGQAVLIAQDRQQHGDLAGAEKIYRLILAVDPNHGDAMFFLGVLVHQMGNSRQAFTLLKLAIEKHPKVYKYHFNFGIICDEVSALEESIKAYRCAIAIDPQPAAWGNLGKVLKQFGELDEAAECCKQCIQLQKHFQNAIPYNNLGTVYQQQGKLKEAIECFAMAVSIDPTDAMAESNYLYTLNFLAQPDLQNIFNAHKNFGARYDRPMAPRPSPTATDSTRKIRVGYVSADFRQHSVAHFIEPILAAHDQSKFELFCYYNYSIVDERTNHMKSLVPNWRLIFKRPDADVAELIRRDGIDILVDLAGHTGTNNLPMFGLKPAPVQVSWIGYPNTTGLSTMDYRITDAFADPQGAADGLHTEKLWRLPECFSCFEAPTNSPDVGPLPLLKNAHITFGSFNNFAKTTPEVIAVWANILKRVPQSRLVLKNKSMAAKHVQTFLHAHFAKNGVGPDQLDFMTMDNEQASHMDRYNSIDIALDPFPYNGTTTTFDALWMGVPMVVLSGNNHVSRVGVSQMRNLGLPELIARDTNDYVNIAVNLANDVPRLTALRAGLRERLKNSPMMNVPRFTKNLEEAYEAMWKIYLGAQAT